MADEVRHAPPVGQGRLAHGDFYLGAVFQGAGRYTGIIDFGSIQGSNRWHDLATVRLFGPEQAELEAAAVPHVEVGYAEVAGAPADFRDRILGTAVTIMDQRMARQYREEGERPGNARRSGSSCTTFPCCCANERVRPDHDHELVSPG